MIRALLIADDREAVELLGSVVRATGEIAVERIVPVAPGSYQLTSALQVFTPDVILLDLTDARKAYHAYEHICSKNPDVPVITFGKDFHGVSTPFLLKPPLSAAGLMHMVRAAVQIKSARLKENVVAIMPAKGGCGATTIAINTAARLARRFGKRVLVCESDLRSGVIADLLNLQPKASTQQTLESADCADSLIWPRHVCNKEGIDFILTRREQCDFKPRWHDYQHLLSFVSKRYDNVLFDLPERINDAAAQVVRTARRVYVVTTPEVLSLALAQQRIADLRAAGVDDGSLKIILNRHHNSDAEPREIEEILDCPVETVIPNGYPAVRAATLANGFVDSRTALGRAYDRCAAIISGGDGQLESMNKRSIFSFLRPARRYDESLVVQRG